MATGFVDQVAPEFLGVAHPATQFVHGATEFAGRIAVGAAAEGVVVMLPVVSRLNLRGVAHCEALRSLQRNEISWWARPRCRVLPDAGRRS